MRRKWPVIAGMALLLSARLLLQMKLYQSGFESLTADEFARVVLAARWAQNPHAVWHGAWLPFHMYLMGTALWLRWDLLFVPRTITILLGLVSIVLMYGVASRLFENGAIGWLSAILLAVNPVHVWLSSTPLTEVPHTTLVLAFMLSFILYWKDRRLRYLYLSALALALANGFRFEAWLFSLVFSLYLIGEGSWRLRRKEADSGQTLAVLAASLIPWGFPIVWLVGNTIATGDPLNFLASVRSYNLTWYGPSKSYTQYLPALWKIDPYATVLGVAGLGAYLFRYRQSRVALWYVSAGVIPLALLAYLLGGQAEPPANYLRYLAPFVLVVYPAVAWLLYRASQFVAPSRSAQSGLLALLTAGIALTQTRTTFQFTNDPAAGGLKVGQRIQALRLDSPGLSQRPVLIELAYWQFLAVHVGANDISRLIYDRQIDLERRQSLSLIPDVEALRQCIIFHQVSHIVVRSPELRQILEGDLDLRPSEEISRFGFYPVPERLTEAWDNDTGTCPLS